MEQVSTPKTSFLDHQSLPDPSKRIAFYLADKRHFDYFGNVINELVKLGEDPVVVINDTRNQDSSNPVDETYTAGMLANAKERGYTCVLSREAIKRNRKFKVIVSTFSYTYKVPLGKEVGLHRFIKLVAKTIGNWLKPLAPNSLKKRIVYFVSDEYSVREWSYPEHLLAEKVFFFPKGLDINDDYPDPLLREIADVYLCHGNFDRRIMEKNIDKEVFAIGYPRYDRLAENDDTTTTSLLQEFGMDRFRPLICWLPTYVEGAANIREWLPHFESLKGDYNVLVRPHPKQLERDGGTLLENLAQTGLFIDQKDDRDMTTLYVQSHLVCCDYGGTIFSAIYTDADLLLLDISGHTEIAKKRECSADILVRKELFHLTLDEAGSQGGLLKIIQNEELRASQRKGIKQAREEYFGGVNIGEGSIKTAKKLISYIS